MRVLVVVAGMTLGLSGCISGGIIHRAPAGNETADGGDASGVEQAPWQLNGTVGSKDGADGWSKKGTDGAGKGSGGTGSGKDGQTGDPGEPGDEPDDENQTDDPSEDGSPLDPVTDQAPTEGAAGADDVLSGAGDAVQDGTDPQTPKDPLGDADDVEAPSEGVSVPTQGGVPVAGTPKSIPNTDSPLA